MPLAHALLLKRPASLVQQCLSHIFVLINRGERIANSMDQNVFAEILYMVTYTMK